MSAFTRRGIAIAMLFIATASAVLAVGPSAATASAATGSAQNAYYYSHWNFAGSTAGYWNVDQQMEVQERAKNTYWAQMWNWTNANFGGYVGLQTNGNRGDGSTGDTAIFSLWNANAAAGPNCAQFGGEGTGLSCRLPYTISTMTIYRYRIWRQERDSQGQWWGAWIENTKTGVDTYIGSIRVAAQYTSMTAVQNFVEYFGPAVACTKIPRSTVVWTQPAANSLGGGLYQYGSYYQPTATDRGNCTGGSATAITVVGWSKGVQVILGG